MRPTVSIILCLLFTTIALAADKNESRFNPKLKGCYLGIIIEETKEGILLKEVSDGSAAEIAGLEKDDIIVRFGDWRFKKGTKKFQDHLANIEPKKIITQVLRDGSELDLEIKPDPAIAKDAKEIAKLISKNLLFRKKLQNRNSDLENSLIEAVRASSYRENAYESMNEIVDSFKISHTAVITPWVAKNLFGEGDKFHLGLFLQIVNLNGKDRFFVRSMMHGSPARETGLWIGDEITSINKIPTLKSPRKTLAGYEHHRKMYTIQIDKGETVEISFRRNENGSIQKSKLTANVPLSAKKSIEKSARLMPLSREHDAGYIHLWNLMSMSNASALRNAMNQKFKNASALIIDLRGRGGKVNVIRSISRTLKEQKKPTVLIIDREARSAKEMLAHRLQGLKHITLVGEVSAGAVLPASFYELSGDAKFMIPNRGGDSQLLRFMKDTRLEGRGAIPDVNVKFELPFSEGKDLILLKAINILKKDTLGKLLRI